jgi:hypothetical protein
MARLLAVLCCVLFAYQFCYTFEFPDEFRDLSNNNAPDDRILDMIVGMSRNISEPDDGWPIADNFQVIQMRLSDSVQGFAYDFKFSFNRRSQHIVGAVIFKALPLGELSNRSCRGQSIEKML